VIREVMFLGIFLFAVCLTCWLIAPGVLGNFSTAQSFTMRVEGAVFMILPLVLFFLIGVFVFKARSGQ
jgi:hypothetical protein